VTDSLAERVLPSLLTALGTASLSSSERSVASLLRSWNSTMDVGRPHSRSFPSGEGAAGLGYGPRAASGDRFTEDAADGGLNATTGPSWRMIVAFGASAMSAVGVYPGGQSENPASPWYTNLVPLWWDGQYLPLPVPGASAGPIEWWLNG
jgi:penicillin G amidase